MKGCARFCASVLLVVLVVAVAVSAIGSFSSRNKPPSATPFPTAPIAKRCILDDEARFRIALYMAEILNSDDVGILQSVTNRPSGKNLSKMFRENNQVFIVRFSALKRGTGKYEKGWIHITLKDEDCSILSHRLAW